MSGIVHKPATDHACTPGWTWTPMREDGDIPPPHPGACYGTPPIVRDYPRGTVWQCDCDQTWVSRGPAPQPANLVFAAGMVPPGWKREGKRARRKRERQGVTPEQVFGAYSGGKPASEVGPPPRIPSATAPTEFMLVDHDGDGQPAGMVVLDPKLVDVVTADGRVVGYRYHGALPCPAPKPADPVE